MDYTCLRPMLTEIGGTSEIYLLDVRCPTYANLEILLKVSSIIFRQRGLCLFHRRSQILNRTFIISQRISGLEIAARTSEIEGVNLQGRKAKTGTLEIRRKCICEIVRISTNEVSAISFSLDLRENQSRLT